jgi:peptide/nickel transport system permease protein
MLKYVIQRLLFTVVVIFGVSILVFVITHLIGNPVKAMLPLQATDAQRAQLAHQLGLDKPIWQQLTEFLGNMIRLDFGVSWWQQVSCLSIVLSKIPTTLVLVGVSFIIAIIIAFPMGIIAAYKPDSLLDRILTTASLIGICLPSFWVALMLVLFFAVKLGWFYTSGYGTIRHLVLPAVTLAVVPAGHIAQIVRFSMAEQLNAQYAVTARAKGVKESVVLVKHVLKNIMTAVLTIGGMDLAMYLAGEAAAVEVVFGWPGFGSLVVDTISRQDFPLLQAEIFVVAVIICLINLIVDMLYAYFDPRITY